MSKECPECQYKNADTEDFCSICGFELGGTDNSSASSTDSSSVQSPAFQTENTESSSTIPEFTQPDSVSTSIPEPTSTIPQTSPELTSIPEPTPTTQPTSSIPTPSSSSTDSNFVSATAMARLIAKQPNAPIKEFSINGSATIGIFTPESGPVDIDLEEFPGQDLVSKQHGEIIYENGTWVVKDLGSTNGIYIKPLGQTKFGARIMQPTPLNFGDEIAFAKIGFTFQTS